MLVQALTEVKIEMLKNHDFFLGEFFLTLSCDRREERDHAHDQHCPTVFTILDIHYFDPYQI